MSITLSNDELKELTEKTRKDKQAEALIAMGIRFTRLPSGRLKVLQSEVNRVMLGGPVVTTEEPDFTHING